MPERLLLVIDADIDNRVATELKYRGRVAVATSELLLHRMKDEPLLRALVDRRGDPSQWVLVTGDDAMPDDHGDVLTELQVTLATIDPRRRAGTKEAEWRRDVIHPLGSRHVRTGFRLDPPLLHPSAWPLASTSFWSEAVKERFALALTLSAAYGHEEGTYKMSIARKPWKTVGFRSANRDTYAALSRAN